jgi:hypothetical protein
MWHQQSEDFEANFPLKGKSDFRLMRDVRSYAPKQTVLWPRCSHGEFCVVQVYQGWNNSGRRFWHCPYAWVSNSTNFLIIFLSFRNVFLSFVVLHPSREMWFLAMGGSTSY